MAAKSNQVSDFVMNHYTNVSDKYEVSKKIGRGSFGDVMMANDVETREKKAIKVIELNFIQNDNINKLVEKIKNEASLMSILDHPNILKYYESFQYNNCLCIVSEYCEDNLTNMLRTHLINNTRPEKQLVIEWFHGLSQGLNYLHDRDIIHRDLKPMNILFKNSVIKIADFGESRLKSQATMTKCGTLAYMSPEMLCNEKFNEKTDIWSLGCVLYEIYYLAQAFDGDSEYALRNNILNRETKHLNTDKKNSEIANLIDKMLDIDKDKRISIKGVLSHNVFKDLGKHTNKKDEKEMAKEEKIKEENNKQVVNKKEVVEEDEKNDNKDKQQIPKMIEKRKTHDITFQSSFQMDANEENARLFDEICAQRDSIREALGDAEEDIWVTHEIKFASETQEQQQ